MKTERNNLILKLYSEGYTGHKIASMIGVNSKTVYTVLSKAGATRSLSEIRKRYTCDDGYFDNIKTSEQAYWLGVLFADGNISKKASNSGQIFLTSKDQQWVIAFMQAIKSSNKPRPELHKKYNKYIWKAQITSAQMYNALNHLGCVPVKSKIIRMPYLKTELVSHFIRGYFDGDGSVGIYQNLKTRDWKILKSNICSGSREFLEDLLKHLPTKQQSINQKAGVYVLQFSLNDSYKLYEYLYKDATVCLERKRKLFEKYIKQERGSTTIIDHPNKDEGIV